jgi:hypothetical protein
MANNDDWLPTTRVGQLAMAKAWIAVLAEKAADWNITTAEKTALSAAATAAEAALEKCLDTASRTHVDSVACNTAFKAMIALMRDMKNRHFFMPPLTPEDFAALGLKVPGENPADPIADPTGIPSGEFVHTGSGQVTVHLKRAAGSIEAVNRADYGVALRIGVMPPGGATVEEARAPKRYLMKVPTDTEELAQNRFTRRAKEIVDFPAAEIGSTAYFSFRYENGAGGRGPWSPVVSVVIS